MTLHTYLAELLSSIKTLTKSQRKFLTEIVCVLFAMRGRANFTNMSRYTHYHESTIRRNYDQPIDIECIFRDARQFTGLTPCQSRQKDRWHVHFNLSCRAINLARAEMELLLMKSRENLRDGYHFLDNIPLFQQSLKIQWLSNWYAF